MVLVPSWAFANTGGLFMFTTEERFWAKVDKNGPLWNGTPCWLWKGATSEGYGRSKVVGRTERRAHRVAYELLIGPIPEGLTLDHLCRTHLCVNGAHLEPVTIKENVLRGEGLTARESRVTHCPRGHPYDLFNTYYNNQGGRSCKKCRLLAAQKWSHKRIRPSRRHTPQRGT